MAGPPTFKWISPDGSFVQAHFLQLGYYQTAFHDSKTPDELIQHLERFASDADAHPRIVPVGADHMGPPRDFAAQLEKLSGTHLSVAPISITDYAQALLRATESGAADLSSVLGELRDNASALKHERAYMLQGVLSTRLYLKRENRGCGTSFDEHLRAFLCAASCLQGHAVSFVRDALRMEASAQESAARQYLRMQRR